MRPWGLGLQVPLIQEPTTRKAQGNLPHPCDRKKWHGWSPRWPGGGMAYLLEASWSIEVMSEN